MNIEARIFYLPAIFFFSAATVYGLLSHWEVVGTVCIALTGALATMIGIYFRMLARRFGERPEDDANAEIQGSPGEQGVYAPWSWWPFVLGLAAAGGFTALAVGWWLMVPAGIIAVIGLVGWVFEFSRGQHAH
jgi:hypothetical protein